MLKEDKLKAGTIRTEILKKVEDYYKAKFLYSKDSENENSKVKYAGRTFDEKEIINIVDSALPFLFESQYKFLLSHIT